MNRAEQRQQIDRFRALGDLLLQARLSALQAAAAARTASLDRLADLDRPAPATDLPALAAAGVGLRYDRWADQRRAEINLTLARQTATWIEARQAAALAFGRSQALDALAQKRT